MKKIDLSSPRKSRHHKKLIRRFVLIVSILAIFTGLIIFLGTLPHSSSVVNFLFSRNDLKSNSGEVNILLLGIAGGTHDGANLTDTIMVASINQKTNQIFLISLPRDLWLPALRSKANAVYEIGLSQNNGLGLSKTIIGNILGLPINYGLRVDFGGFEKAVDNIGGIDVLVDKSFDDFNFPIAGKENDLCGYEEKEIDFSEDEARKLNIDPGKRKVMIAPDGKIATDSAEEDKGAKYFSCRFEHIHFTSGLTHMDGETALKFVRSRHGTNGQGSDFARSKRQQLVLEAFKKKAFSIETLFSPNKIEQLIKTFGKSIDTDISVKESLEFYQLFRKVDKISTLVVDDSAKIGLPDGRKSLLVHPLASDYGGAYVLISQDDDFSSIQSYVRKVLAGEIKENESSGSARTGN